MKKTAFLFSYPTSNAFPLLVATAAFLVLLSGCQSNRTMKRVAAKNPLAKNVVKTPTRMVDVWRTYAQTTPEGQPMRGIAGRVHFYDEGHKKKSIKVDGDVTIFVFDAEEKDPAHAKPLKVFKFPANTLKVHYSHKKPLGHGYDFFLPIDEIDGEEKNLCVMTRFDDALEGGLVLAPPINTKLHGSKRNTTPETSFQQFLANNSALGKMEEGPIDPTDIRQVSFNDRTGASSNASEPALRTVATIRLNEGMTRRLSQQSAETVPEPSYAPSAPSREVETAVWMKEKESETEPPASLPSPRMPEIKMPQIKYPK